MQSFLTENIKDLGLLPYSPNFNEFFLWFDDMNTWKEKLEAKLKDYLKNPENGVADAYTTIIFHRHHSLSNNGNIVTLSSYNFYRISLDSFHFVPGNFTKSLSNFKNTCSQPIIYFPKNYFLRESIQKMRKKTFHMTLSLVPIFNIWTNAKSLLGYSSRSSIPPA